MDKELLLNINKYYEASTLDNIKISAELDLKETNDISLSSVMREINKQEGGESARNFLRLYKTCFDYLIVNEVEDPEDKSLKTALELFSKLESKVFKVAQQAPSNSQMVGKYLANIIKFTLSRISDKNRPKSINSLKNKIYQLNESALAEKKMPASASMGQAITFVKHVLFNRDAKYIRSVLNYIVSYL